MKCLIIILIFSTSAVGQWTMSGTSVTPPPPPPGSEPWRGILDYSRAANWSNVGVQGGIPVYTRDCGTVSPAGLRAWESGKTYNLNDRIADSRGNLETVITAGTSGTTEPAWPWNSGNTTDNTVVWSMSPGGTDSANVTNAIIACDNGSGVGGVVNLAAGHFYFTAGIVFNKGFGYPLTSANPAMTGPVSNVRLKGQGPMQTYLHFPRVGPCSGEICIQASWAGPSRYAAGGGYSAAAYPGGGANWLGGSTLGTYTKGDTTLMVGPWTPTEPDQGDVVFLDQNNDSFGICPATPPSPAYNCTIAGATEVGTTVTIVTSVPHGYHVGQCVGIGDVGGRFNGANVGYNTAANPDKTTICDDPSGSGLNPGMPSWWRITAVGCIVSSAFVDQSSCAANPLVAFQYTAGVSGLAPNGGGQTTTDTGGTWLSTVNGATMVMTGDTTESARLCPETINTPAGPSGNSACLPGEISFRSSFEAKVILQKTPGGQGSCPVQAYMCYTVDSPLYSNNWRSSQHPGAWWTGKKDNGDGVEGFTLLIEHDPGSGSMGGIRFTNAWNGWVRNVRGIEINRNLVWNLQAGRISILDNYVGGTKGGSSTAYVFEDAGSADVLVMNNICQHTVSCLMTKSTQGTVRAYNYMIDSGATQTPDQMALMITMNHLGAFYNLFEGNNSPGLGTDNLHGTGGVSTAFRSRLVAQDLPEKYNNRNSVMSQSFNRGLSFVANVMGLAGVQNRYIEDRASTAGTAVDRTVFQVGRWRMGTGAYGNDPLAVSSMLRWGNYDSATGTTRWCGTGTEGANCSCGSLVVGGANMLCRVESEIPAAFTFLSANAIPGDHTLPTSFFLSAQPYFWTTTWGTPGWPAIGPDVDATGSPLDTTCAVTPNVVGTGPGTFTQCDGVAHHAYQIPAQICYNNLPVDPQFQLRDPQNQNPFFTVTGASHNGVTGAAAEVTLTVNNNLNTASPFTITVQVSGIIPSGYNGTYLLHAATPTTLTYWLATNPGPYQSGGTVSTPNYKQFDAHMCYPNLPY